MKKLKTRVLVPNFELTDHAIERYRERIYDGKPVYDIYQKLNSQFEDGNIIEKIPVGDNRHVFTKQDRDYRGYREFVFKFEEGRYILLTCFAHSTREKMDEKRDKLKNLLDS
jgi:hypothetical protein